jgi:hypothetical protein
MNAPVRPDALAAASPELAMVTMGFGNMQQFEFMLRAANLLTQSSLVPAAYRKWVPEGGKRNAPLVENPNAIPNTMIALNMSQRMRADVLMVMQNLNIIEGKPSWASAFIISMINTCGRFRTLRYRIEDLGDKEVTYHEVKWEGPQDNRQKKYYPKTVTIRNLSCVAYTTDIATGEELCAPAVSVEMAVVEGWYGREGSKWQTLTELMLHYRSAAFFGRIYAPELLMGLRTADELVDMGMLQQAPDGIYEPADTGAGETGAPAAAPAPTSMRPQTKSAQAAAPSGGPAQAAQAQSSAAPAAPAATPAAAPTPAAATPAAEPAAAPAPAAAPQSAAAPQAAAPAASGPTCSEGSRKFLLKKFAAQPEALLPALNAAGFSALNGSTPEKVKKIVDTCDGAALDGLTEDQFKTVKSQIPR